MASTRLKATTRRTAAPVHAGTTKQALLALVRHGTRLQIAAATAAAETLVEWAKTADRLAQTLGDELLRHVDGETDSAELVARITTAGSTHLRELAALPAAAANHFDTRLARASTDN